MSALQRSWHTSCIPHSRSISLVRSHSQSTLTDWLTHFDESGARPWKNAPAWEKINRIFCRKAKVQNPISKSLFSPYIHSTLSLFLSPPQRWRVVNTSLNLNTHTQHSREQVRECICGWWYFTRALFPGRTARFLCENLAERKSSPRPPLFSNNALHAAVPSFVVERNRTARAWKIWVTPWGQIHSPFVRWPRAAFLWAMRRDAGGEVFSRCWGKSGELRVCAAILI
jgi:hypothetical protein